MESISSNVFFNLEYLNKIYKNKGPIQLINILKPILNKTFIKNNKTKIIDVIINDNIPINAELKLYET